MEMQESNIVKVFGMKELILSSLLLVLGCTNEVQKVPYYFTRDLSPTWDREAYKGDKHTVDAFSFLNQDGKIYNSDSVTGKIYIANFFFTTCPSICPMMTENLKKVQDLYEHDNGVKLLSFSVTPNIDSVARLKEYYAAKKLKSNWHLLTGNQKEIYDLSRNSFFVEEEIGLSKDSSDFLHTERCVLVDASGYMRGVYNATLPLDINRLIEDITLLRKN